MEYTNDIICTVGYVKKQEEIKNEKKVLKKLKKNKILSLAISLFFVLVLADVVLVTNFIKILSTI